MRKSAYILENNNGKVARYIDWNSKKLLVIYRRDTRRVVFLENSKELEDKKIDFEILKEVTQDQVDKAPVSIGKLGHLKAVDSVEDVQKDVQLKPEDEKNMPIFMKYSAATHISILFLILGSAFIINKFFNKPVAPIEVQVFTQNREFVPPKPKTIAQVQKRLEVKKIRAARVSNRTHIAKQNTSRNSKNRSQQVVARPGQNLSNMGALGVLGGMSKHSNGSGGLNLNAKTNNPGIGYGGPAQRGGFERGLVGKGLIATGMGNGGSLKGYGGYGTSGKGGGKPGYGTMKMAGSSAGYFEPLRDESLVEGGLDQDQIDAVIQRNKGQITYCYEQGLQTQPKLSGRVRMKFVINASGAVSVASVGDSSLDSQKVESCIVSKLRGWKFPRPVGSVNVRVTYPFMLNRAPLG
jgi:hypothetical protein